MEGIDKVIDFEWGHNRRYNDYATYIRRRFGGRVQKLSINAGFTCPNRDGAKGYLGCSYCNNSTFKPEYCKPEKSVTQQIEEGIGFFSRKYPDMRFLAYFQSYSNTYGSIELLEQIYSEALSHRKIDGMVIGTRPDCVNDEILDLIRDKSQDNFATIEYGIESTSDSTLRRINRQHTYQEAVEAIWKTKERDIPIGAHLIMGLPDESNEDQLLHATRISELPIDALKLHQLQIVKNTAFAKEFKNDPTAFHLFEMREYIEFVIDFLELLNPRISVERFVNQSPANMLIAPKWGGIKNFEIVAKIEKRLMERNTWQGRCYEK